MRLTIPDIPDSERTPLVLLLLDLIHQQQERLVLHQYDRQRVTQPLLLEQLWQLGLDSSAGQLNNLLTEDRDAFHQEKAELLPAGLQVSAYIQVDDTGARHQGQTGFCTHIGNDL